MQARLSLLYIRIKPLLESGVWVGFTTLTKAITQMIIVKWIAIKFGPSVLGVTGQAMSLISILQALAGGGIANGIIRRFALESTEEKKKNEFLSASFTYGLIFSALFLVVFGLGAKPISSWAFGHDDYSWFVMLLGFAVFFSFVSIFSQAVLSAKNLVRNIFWAHFFGLTLGIAVFTILTRKYGEPGIFLGLLATIIGPAVFFVPQLFDKPWFSFSSFLPSWNPHLKKSLIPFTLIATIGSALAPTIFVLLRSGIEQKMGWEYVGYWQAILKVYDFLFSFIGLFIASTFYPKIAAARNSKTAMQQALQFAISFAGILAVALLLTGVLGELILSLLYSDAYRFLKTDLDILLFGGFFRALAWLATYFLMARNHLKAFLIFEVISSGALYLICKTGLEFGFRGLIWGQVVHSVFYLTILGIGIVYMKRTNRV
jgi:O-antigen/teichoic acid export membrane protein